MAGADGNGKGGEYTAPRDGGAGAAPGAIRWTYAFVDRPAAAFARACAFWTAVTATGVSEPRATGVSS